MRVLILLALIATLPRPPIPADPCRLHAVMLKGEAIYCRICRVPSSNDDERSVATIDCSMNGRAQR